MEKITGVVSAWNAEDTLEACLKSLSFVDELIVVDNSSTDKTVHIAKKFNAKIYTRPNYPMLNTNKNYGFEQATGDWILNLDSDEEIPEALKKEISVKIRNSTVMGYWMPRKNIMFGKWIQHGLWWPDRHIRLFRKGKGKFPCKHVHEYIHVDGQTEVLDTPFIHHHYHSISQYLKKMDTIYTENEVQNLIATNYQLSWFDAVRFPVSDFVKIFFAQEGYKDGLHGLVLATLQSFYSFIVFAKLWEKNRFEERSITLSAIQQELVRAQKETGFWMYTSRIKEVKNPIKKFLLKIRKRLIV